MTLKHFVAGLVGLLLIVSFADQGWSAVQGEWTVAGTLSVAVSIKGLGVEKEVTEFQEEFTFQEDGDFEGDIEDVMDLIGTWRQTGKKFTVQFNPQDVEAYLEEGLSYFAPELDVNVEEVKISLTGTENTKTDMIKGKISLNANLGFTYYGVDLKGKVKAAGTFTGARLSGDEVEPVSRKLLSDEPSAFGEAMTEKIVEVLQKVLKTGH